MKKLILIICLLLSFNISYGYDFEETINLEGLGNIRDSSPLNFYDLQINNDGATVYINFVSNSCDYDNAYFLEVLGVGNIECQSNANYGLNYGEFNMDSGVYELYFKNQTNEYYYIVSDVNIGVNYATTSSSSSGGSSSSSSGGTSTGYTNTTIFEGDFFDVNYKEVGFFVDYDEFIEFAEETTIIYMIGLLLITLGFFSRAIHNSID